MITSILPRSLGVEGFLRGILQGCHFFATAPQPSPSTINITPAIGMLTTTSDHFDVFAPLVTSLSVLGRLLLLFLYCPKKSKQ
mmetsp:Transcript_18655/g.31740  ORF Transcript_18655/g.31740 Transcript_18655/m.31740 type:complete len:83 (-) Transcript_18655:725-973(-)